MGIDIKVPMEIDDYQEKLWFGLSKRQLLWSFLAVAEVVCTFSILYWPCHLTLMCALLPALVLTIPLWAVGWMRPMGLPMEGFALRWARWAFGAQRLPYKTDLSAFPVDGAIPLREGPMSKKERKDYVKAMAKEDRKEFKRQSERTCGRIGEEGC